MGKWPRRENNSAVSFPPVKKGATSVRFSEELSAILKRIAALYEANDVDVVRWAVKALGVYHDAHGHLPPMEASSQPMILHEPPRAESKSGSSGARGKMKTGARR